MRGQRLCGWIALCLLCLCAASAGAAEAVPGVSAWPYKDVPAEHKYYPQISYGVEQGYITAQGPLYEPDSPVTRKEALGSLWIVSGKTIIQVDDFPFDDPETLPDSDEGRTAVWAYIKVVEQGVRTLQGNFYRGNEKITRGKLITYLYGASLKDPVMKTLGPVDMETVKYSDVDRKDAGYDAKAVAWGLQNGIIDESETVDGVPRFRPDDTCKKGEFSDMMCKYAKKKAELKAAQETQAALQAQGA